MPSPIPAISEDYSDIIVKKNSCSRFGSRSAIRSSPSTGNTVSSMPRSRKIYTQHIRSAISVYQSFTPLSVSPVWSAPASFLPRHSPISDSSGPEFSSVFSTPASTTGIPPSEKQTERPGSLLSGISPIQPELHRKVFPMAVNTRRIPSIRHSFLKSLIASFPPMILMVTEPPSPGLPAAAPIRSLILPVRHQTAPLPS